jgi:hypothetical protein
VFSMLPLKQTSTVHLLNVDVCYSSQPREVLSNSLSSFFVLMVLGSSPP